MSRTRSTDTLGAYTSAGGLLPAATLRRVVDQPDTMPDGSADGYGLPPKSKLDEHIDRAWHDARAYWNDFTAHATDAGLLDTNADPTTGDRPGDPTLAKLTVNRLVLPLLDLLGWHDIDRRRNGIEGDADRRDSDGNRMRWPVTHETAKRHVPVHIVGYDVPLDTRTRGVYGAERQSPHSTVQDLLNGSEKHLWGIAINGRHLRLLRDSSSLTRQAYAEFDLHAILHDGAYAEFAALWLLLHASRFTVPDADDATTADTPIERLQREATDDGIRALDHLRDGVKDAIEDLGTGLIAHPRNQPLRDALASGELTDGDFYNQVLRTVYRLVFLFAVEDRNLLHPSDADPDAEAVYADYYSTLRLREQARKHRGGRHGDGWQHYQQLVRFLRGGQPALAIPPVAGWLWSHGAAAHVDACALDNTSLYSALRHLSTIEQDKSLHRVSYKHLGAEELGSVYESLLELTPRSDGRTFRLDEVAGNERRTTGSYYTPTSLITVLLDEALDPVIDRATADALDQLPGNATPDERADALDRAVLGLTVCDPAMGSAHFLVAAAHRLAKRLAVVRTGDPEPDPLSVQAALRDVVSHCIYGVDVNPMAVELAKVSLWLECHLPGTPMTFLDHHLKHGNSLLGIGFDRGLIAWDQHAKKAADQGGVPDAAFKTLTGDQKCPTKKQQNKKSVRGEPCPGCGQPLPCGNNADVPGELKSRNARRRAKGGHVQLGASLATHDDDLDRLADTAKHINWLDDTTPQALEAKHDAWMAYGNDAELARLRLRADAWTACWTMPKTETAVRRLLAADDLSDDDLPADVYYDTFFNGVPAATRPGVQFVQSEADRLDFFHWFVEFPDIAETGGFDLTIGNPPWEHVELKEKEWFAAAGYPDIAGAKNASQRKKMIAALSTSDDPLESDVADRWLSDTRDAQAASELIRNAGRYPLGGVGRVNTYATFADHFVASVSDRGRVGIIVPTGLVTDYTYREFFAALVDEQRLVAVYDFINRRGLFPDVAPPVRFVTLVVAAPNQSNEARFAFMLEDPSELVEPDRSYALSAEQIASVNPNTKTAPVFLTPRDAAITTSVYRRHPVLIDNTRSDGNPWEISFKQGLFNMATDSGHFRTAEELEPDGWTVHGNIYERGDERMLPLYEAKLFRHYDADHNSFEDVPDDRKFNVKAGVYPTDREAGKVMQPRYWVAAPLVADALIDKWGSVEPFLAWRDITNVTTNQRTIIPAWLPPFAANHMCLLARTSQPGDDALVLAAWASFALDYIGRQKISGSHFTFNIMEQMPMPRPERFKASTPWDDSQTLREWVASRSAALSATTPVLADALGYASPVPWDENQRELWRTELDAAMFHIYGYSRDDVDYVMDTFPIVRRNDNRAEDRDPDDPDFRTKRTILAKYDDLARCAAAGTHYESPAAPPALPGRLRPQ